MRCYSSSVLAMITTNASRHHHMFLEREHPGGVSALKGSLGPHIGPIADFRCPLIPWTWMENTAHCLHPCGEKSTGCKILKGCVHPKLRIPVAGASNSYILMKKSWQAGFFPHEKPTSPSKTDPIIHDPRSSPAFSSSFYHPSISLEKSLLQIAPLSEVFLSGF